MGAIRYRKGPTVAPGSGGPMLTVMRRPLAWTAGRLAALRPALWPARARRLRRLDFRLVLVPVTVPGAKSSLAITMAPMPVKLDTVHTRLLEQQLPRIILVWTNGYRQRKWGGHGAGPGVRRSYARDDPGVISRLPPRQDQPVPESPAPPSSGNFRPYHWLAALPIVAMLGGIPFANRVEPYVFGLPFLMAWILVWVVLTSAAMAVVYRLDRRRERDRR
jgi:Protein of unknown function (DUF3311)